jgi:hypothetical protein
MSGGSLLFYLRVRFVEVLEVKVPEGAAPRAGARLRPL